jgi:hypothetical protein
MQTKRYVKIYKRKQSARRKTERTAALDGIARDREAGDLSEGNGSKAEGLSPGGNEERKLLSES